MYFVITPFQSGICVNKARAKVIKCARLNESVRMLNYCFTQSGIYKKLPEIKIACFFCCGTYYNA